ncbi:hypothetical protein F4778DRAFT_379640 [Xylariomycetidae sp. FL2044]|nr:hypothetical protein F4778DRAFT_379640 [Xylariomycetidae sp. FL2044]
MARSEDSWMFQDQLDGHAGSRTASTPELPLYEWPPHMQESQQALPPSFNVYHRHSTYGWIGHSLYSPLHFIKSSYWRDRHTLHTGPNASSPVWAFVGRRKMKTWIEIPPQSSSDPDNHRLRLPGNGLDEWYIVRKYRNFTISINGKDETFQWRPSKSEEVRSLGWSRNG